MKDEMLMTEKLPAKESAIMAPTMGKRLTKPKPTLLIFVAAMLPILNFVIRNTIQFEPQPPAATERPVRFPVTYQNESKKKLALEIFPKNRT